MSEQSMTKRFGLEIEFAHSSECPVELGERLTARMASRYNKHPRIAYSHPNWILDTEHCGYELVSPPLLYNKIDDVRKIMTVIEDAGVSIVPREMGMHVHITRSFNEQRMMGATLLWHAFEPLMLQLVHRSRRNNRWCSPIRSREYPSDLQKDSDVDDLLDYVQDYRGAFAISSNWPTYEIRLHQSTTNYSDTRAWVCLLMALVTEGEHYGNRGFVQMRKATDSLYNAMARGYMTVLPLLRRILHHQLPISTAEMTWRNILTRLES